MLKFEDWGLIEYEQALEKQLQKVQDVVDSQSENFGFLIFCSHPAVVTLGRKTQSGDVYAWQGPVIEVSRGGRATYHGPSQLVVYPILKIKDIGKYLRSMEESIVTVLRSYGIQAVGRTRQKNQDGNEGSEETGVWVGSQKIASLGIGVKKWVTYHGAAINLDEDPSAFSGMKPCGFTNNTMVSLERLTGQKINRHIFSEKLKTELLKVLLNSKEGSPNLTGLLESSQ